MSKPGARWAGVEIAGRSLKLVVIEESAGARRAQSLIQELPVGPSEHVDRVGWLQAALQELKVPTVYLAVGGPEVLVRRVLMPPMPRRELLEAVKWEMKDHLSVPIEQADLAVQVVGTVWDRDVKKQDVLVAAAAHASVQAAVSAAERSGVRVAGITPDAAALWSSVAALVPEAKQGSVAVVDVGATRTVMVVAQQGTIQLVRSLPLGSAAVTEALLGVVASERGEITIDPGRAEAITRQYGVVAEGTPGATDEGVPLSQVAVLIRPVLERLLTEVSRVCDFYKIQIHDTGLTRVYLCGAGAVLPGLASFLGEGLGIAVEVFDPLARLPASGPGSPEPSQGPRLAVAAGLALERGRGLNFLAAASADTGLGAVPWRPAARAVAGVVLAVWLLVEAAAWWTGWQVRRAEGTWAVLEPSFRSVSEVVAQCATLDACTRRLSRFLDAQPLWEGLWKELAALTPPAIALTSLVVEPETEEAPERLVLRLRGEAAAEEGGISAFLDALDHSVFLQRVELVSSEMRTGAGSGTTFELVGVLE
jgi:type IV pilus assembly protein PilM